MFTKKILAAAITSQPSANGVADAIDFDGATDYLSRSSDLVGNADGKTFTFSAWVWINAGVTGVIGANSGGAAKWHASTDGFGLFVVFYDASGAIVFDAYITGPGSSTASKTFLHVLMSVDTANSSNRSVYINDTPATVTWTSYSNVSLKFTHTNYFVGYDGTHKTKGRLAHVFLDKTYRDLSVEANRRLFITADRKPAANQAALNPILYLPLNDPTQPGKNLGTGGDFALNGVVARSGRGPSQFNAPYSDLNGTSQYLSRTTALTGIADGKQFTFSCVFNADAIAGYRVVTFGDGGTNKFIGALDTNGTFYVQAWNSAGASMLKVQTVAPLSIGRNYQVLLSFDLTNTSSRSFYLNGQSVSVIWSDYVDDNIDFTYASPIFRLGATLSAASFNGRLGNVFFDTKYIDLSVPANLAKFVTGTGIDAKPADLGANGEKPFGTPPLIYLPMYGNNAGKNYGTGGDFTVNSGPFAGSRGPNEFWGNKADFDGTTGYLSRTSALTGVSDGKTFSCSFWVTFDASSKDYYVLGIRTAGSASGAFYIYRTGTNTLRITGWDTNNNAALIADTSASFAAGSYYIHICVDLSNPAKRFIYSNNVEQAVTWSTYSSANIAFSSPNLWIGDYNGALLYELDGKLSEFYFTTDYIDFSQEANRLKFRDAFGNPVDLTPQIAAGTLPNPAIYMRFDPANFGKNSGTGGDFVVNGTITDGGQL